LNKTFTNFTDASAANANYSGDIGEVTMTNTISLQDCVFDYKLTSKLTASAGVRVE
jgi:hypothetical protein